MFHSGGQRPRRDIGAEFRAETMLTPSNARGITSLAADIPLLQQTIRQALYCALWSCNQCTYSS